MKSVYLVFYEYWDRHVEIVCSSRPKAMTEIRKLRKEHPEFPPYYAFYRRFVLDKKGQNPGGRGFR